MAEIIYKEVNVTPITWVATNELRWKARFGKKSLQQKWVNKSTKVEEWRDIIKVTA